MSAINFQQVAVAGFVAAALDAIDQISASYGRRGQYGRFGRIDRGNL